MSVPQATPQRMLVTLPSVAELQAVPFDYRLSDFALFSGALPQQTNSLKAKDPVAFGSVWTTSLFDHHEVFTMTVDKVFSYLPVRCPTFPHAKHVAVAPRFVNPERSGVGAYYYRGNEYLTYHGAMVYQSRTMVTPSQAQKLTAALVHGKLATINNLPYPEYAEDRLGIANSPLTNPYIIYGNFYRYQKQNYALYCYPNPQTKQNQYYWFHCEPIRVWRDQEHHAIQVLEPLFAASYEAIINQTSLVQYLNAEDRQRFIDHLNESSVPSCRHYRIDPNYTPLGEYLNTGFMNQLAMSTNFAKIDQIQQANTSQVAQDSDLVR